MVGGVTELVTSANWNLAAVSMINDLILSREEDGGGVGGRRKGGAASNWYPLEKCPCSGHELATLLVD